MRRDWVGLVCALAFGAAFTVTERPALAEEIVISGYGVSPSSMPYAIALAKGYFKEEGADVTAIRSAVGAGVVRDMIAGDLTYGEANIVSVVAANEQGQDIRVISSNVNTMGDVIWVTMPNSPVKSLKEIKGKRVSFTTPLSATQALDYMLLETDGLKQDEVQLIAAGGFPQSLTALEHDGVDVACIVEPLFSSNPGKYRAIGSGNSALPIMANVLGLTTAKKAKEHPDFLKAVLRARRKAVQFMKVDPAAAAPIVAAVWKIDQDVAERVIRNLIDHGGVGDVPYFGEGEIHLEGIDNILKAERLIGVVKGDVDVTSIIDVSFLPEDLKSKSQLKK